MGNHKYIQNVKFEFTYPLRMKHEDTASSTMQLFKLTFIFQPNWRSNEPIVSRQTKYTDKFLKAIFKSAFAKRPVRPNYASNITSHECTDFHSLPIKTQIPKHLSTNHRTSLRDSPTSFAECFVYSFNSSRVTTSKASKLP